MSYLSELNNKIAINTSGSVNLDSKQALGINISNTKSDLVKLAEYINLVLYPMLQSLPSGGSYPNDPTINGLSASTIITQTIALGNNVNADTAYWFGDLNGRPKTIKETFDTLISRIKVLQNQINSIEVPATPDLTEIYSSLDTLINYSKQLFVEAYGAQTEEHRLTGSDNPVIPSFTLSSLLYQVYSQLVQGHAETDLNILDASSHQGFVLKINKAAIELLFDDLLDVNVSSAQAEQSLVFDGTNWINQKIQLDSNTEGAYVKSLAVSADLTKTETHAHGNEYTIGLSDSGVVSGDYFKVTVDSKGRVTSGENPTTLEGFGITDAVNSNLIGAPDGIAPLNGSSKIDAVYLPSYVDDVVEYANEAAFPELGESGKIYVALDTNKIYRWATTVYVEVSPGSTNVLTGINTVSPLHKDGDPLNPTLRIYSSSANNLGYVVQRDASGNFAASNATLNSLILGQTIINQSSMYRSNNSDLIFQQNGGYSTFYGLIQGYAGLGLIGGSSNIIFNNPPAYIGFNTYSSSQYEYEAIQFNMDATSPPTKSVTAFKIYRPGLGNINATLRWDELANYWEFNQKVKMGNILLADQTGGTNVNTITTSTGGLTLDSQSGTVSVNDNLYVQGYISLGVPSIDNISDDLLLSSPGLSGTGGGEISLKADTINISPTVFDKSPTLTFYNENQNKFILLPQTKTTQNLAIEFPSELGVAGQVLQINDVNGYIMTIEPRTLSIRNHYSSFVGSSLSLFPELTFTGNTVGSTVSAGLPASGSPFICAWKNKTGRNVIIKNTTISCLQQRSLSMTLALAFVAGGDNAFRDNVLIKHTGIELTLTNNSGADNTLGTGVQSNLTEYILPSDYWIGFVLISSNGHTDILTNFQVDYYEVIE